jgi:uracil-DNA glycosylase
MKKSIAIVGEAWGAEEEKDRMAFTGWAGNMLNRLLDEADIRRQDCLVTNVFQLRPHNNDILSLTGPKEEALPGYPALDKSKYVRAEFAPQLHRLASELLEADPNVIVTLGNTAMWAMLGKTKISKLRGVTDTSTHTATGFKVLPTYHPAAIIRQYSLRPITIIDLIKAKRESAFPEIRRPKREIWIEPTIEDLYEFDRRYLQDCKLLAEDIETAGQHITCVGFGPTSTVALVIPFFDGRKPDRNYWPDHATERKAWEFIADVNQRPGICKLFQNGAYDICFLWRANRIRVINAAEDTMLLHHSLQPESLKSLGFMGSIYTDEGPWKSERTDTIGTIKAED